MVKKAASGVLESRRDSTYWRVRFASALAAGLLDDFLTILRTHDPFWSRRAPQSLNLLATGTELVSAGSGWMGKNGRLAPSRGCGPCRTALLSILWESFRCVAQRAMHRMRVTISCGESHCQSAWGRCLGPHPQRNVPEPRESRERPSRPKGFHRARTIARPGFQCRA